MSARIRVLTLLATLGVLGWATGLAPTSASGLIVHNYETALTGTPTGEFGVPWGMAFDSTTGNLYIADAENKAVDIFTSANVFAPPQLTSEAFGQPFTRSVAVDDATGFVYVGESGTEDVDVFKPLGGNKYELVQELHVGGFVYVAVDNHPVGPADKRAGDVYILGENVYVLGELGPSVRAIKPVAKGEPKEGELLEEGERLPGKFFGAEGNQLFGREDGLAVNGATGDLYVANPGNEAGAVVEVFNDEGVIQPSLAPRGAETPAKSIGVPIAVGIDESTGEVYVVDSKEKVVDEFSKEGKYLGQIKETAPGNPLVEPLGVAVSPAGHVYVSDAGTAHRVDVYGPDFNLEPEVIIGAASNVGGQTATLNGTVNPESTTVTKCQFEYGLDTSYGSTAPCSPAPGSGKSPVAVTANLSGLQPGRFYHYRLFVEFELGGATGVVEGTDETLETELLAPTVNDRPAFASNISQFAATLNGTINPGNVPTNYHFVYGPTTAYGSVAPVPDLYTPVNFTDDQVVQQLTGLQPGTTYYFALVASGPGETDVTGLQETFRTPAIPAPVVSTGSAGGVTQGAVTLSGTIDPVGWETTYTFRYGTSAAFGQQWPTVPVALGALSGAQGVSVGLENLQPSTTYVYALCASHQGSSEGPVCGAPQTFTTTAYPLSVIQEVGVPATVTVSITKAVVRGGSLLVTVTTSQKGTVKITGNGLRTTTSRNVAAGSHQFKVGLTKTGKKLARAHRKTSVTATLAVGTQSASNTLNVKL
jgi:hypothetical protein